MDKNKDLHIVTEVGIFGELDINDPTIKKIKNKNNENLSESDLQEMIQESIQNNSNIHI